MQNAIEAMLALAMIMMTTAGALITTGKTYEGLAVAIVSVGIIWLRGTFKTQ